MKVVILSGKANQGLSWITAGASVGSLQLVNRPLVNFAIESLQQQLEICCFQVLGDSHSKQLINHAETYLDWETSIQEYTDDSKCNSDEVL